MKRQDLTDEERKLPLLYITDPGHGWLRVDKEVYPMAHLSGTGCGYVNVMSGDKDHIYLEEDCEMTHFLENLNDGTLQIPEKHVEWFNRNGTPNARWYVPSYVRD